MGKNIKKTSLLPLGSYIRPSHPDGRQSVCVCVLTDKRSIHLSNKVTPCLLLSPPRLHTLHDIGLENVK